jgi:HEAT repeat protein
VNASEEGLIKILNDPQANLRLQYYAISTFGERGGSAAAEVIARFLDSPNLLLKKNAIIALGKLPQAGTPDLADRMNQIIRDPNFLMLAPFASESLGRFGATSRDQILRLIAESKKPDLISYGIDAAQSLPNADPEISTKLIEIIDLDNKALREKAVAALGDHKVQVAVPKLITLLSGKDENLANLAVVALGKIGDRSAIQPILDLYNRKFQGMAIYSIRGNQDQALQELAGDQRSRTRDEWVAFFAKAKP